MFMTKTGIRFEVSQGFTTNCLFKILNCIVNENLNWHIINAQTEIWADADGKEFFSQCEYGNEDFFRLIADNHYAVFAKIQAYVPPYSFYEIHTKEEFMTSDCSLLLLICDNTWCDIYTKDTAMLEKLFENAIDCKFDNVNYIYDSIDKRTKLDVM